MAESNLTKHALANALRALMEELPFEKISVGQICETCGMSRKSFYYHFKDKYDLVNWIFDADFCSIMETVFPDRWTFLAQMCLYLDENREFYRKVVSYRGQNAFRDHLREVLYPLLDARLKQISGVETIDGFCLDFFADGFVGGVERWLESKNEVSVEQICMSIESLMYAICNTYTKHPDIFRAPKSAT